MRRSLKVLAAVLIAIGLGGSLVHEIRFSALLRSRDDAEISGEAVEWKYKSSTFLVRASRLQDYEESLRWLYPWGFLIYASGIGLGLVLERKKEKKPRTGISPQG